MKKTFIDYFEKICSVPHGSGNTKDLSQYCCDVAKQNGLEYNIDESGNVIIKLPPSVGKENAPTVIIQGHLDMVCAKTPDYNINFETESIEIIKNGDFIHAKNTSLGADDGIAVAYALALMNDKTILHPPLEIILTTDEETGMSGAESLDCSKLKGKMMINIDSDREGIFTVSCAGGVNVHAIFDTYKNTYAGTLVKINITGFKGGHSGTEINTGVLNANKVLGYILKELNNTLSLKIAKIHGGDKSNAIAAYAKAEFIIDPQHKKVTEKTIIDCFDKIKNVAKHDPELDISINFDNNASAKAANSKISEKIIDFLNSAPNGVISTDENTDNSVKTSLNLGTVRTFENTLEMTFSLRSSSEIELDNLKNQISDTAKKYDCRVYEDGKHPTWEYKDDSELTSVMSEVYENKYGKKPIISAIHAGLECAVFSDKIENLDAVSIGPNIYDIHTVNEKLSVSSATRVWEFLKDVLQHID